MLCHRFQLTRLEGKKKQELLYEGLFKVTRMVKDSVAELEGLPMGGSELYQWSVLAKILPRR